MTSVRLKLASGPRVHGYGGGGGGLGLQDVHKSDKLLTAGRQPPHSHLTDRQTPMFLPLS